MVQVGFKSDRGLKRKNNEDACFVIPEDKLYIVADGVGGGNSGEVASRLVVSHIAERVKKTPIKTAKRSEDIKAYLVQSIKEANELICKMAEEDPETHGMATTVVLAYINRRKLYVLNVGDSRAYLLRDYQLTQITEDHTYVNTLIKSGAISEEDARTHPQKNIITRALGGELSVEPDIFEVKLMKNDILLLCTDGLHGEVEDRKICEILNSGMPMSELCNQLITKANRSGGNDNITVVCVKI
ncbi:Stp1/IreP family PP2C-type Ser/Thr phosphatase [Clostridium aminobutyricum]|uniref:Stp1/IreP family PP2C-type Ser/Thr phosphatase n=1 Tax=Clostridium aminobutyricum TaxID=33953 RepID=A0A939D6K7_CLOAM|nr:Stp1/IreP family PP2C-type Ser/Thr phosphatase [Clostridium aminobutyricum]MBN7772050.1 Stp1/IreP family PP2C-type Ser/Thr phosphatase [Clostridium aminobutyricum]